MKVASLDDLTNITSGFAWKSNGFNKDNEGIPIIRIQNMYPAETNDFISWNNSYDPTYLINKGDLLLSMSGSFKLDIWTGPKALLNQRIAKVEIKNDKTLSKKYLYYVLRNSLKRIASLSTQTSIANLSIGNLRSFKVSIPSFEEQLNIVKRLEMTDVLIEKRRQSLAKLDQLAQSIFLDMFGDPVTNPKGWKEVLITNVATEAKHAIGIGPFGSDLLASDYRDSGVPLVFVKNIREKKFSGSLTKYVTKEKAKALKAHTVSPRDVLMTKMGDPPGDPAVYPEGLDSAVITADCIKITVNEEIIDPYFLCAQFDTSMFREVVAGMARGVAQKKINLELYKSLKIILPPKKEQTAFVKSLTRLRLLKKDLMKSENRLISLQQSLSQKFFGD